ncbi:MAG: hypothetical protein J6P99_05730, partial [Paludibacteraceae bacterium]|nr:hypothetical protein [Paludibacteraceae bacterium]
MKTRSLLSIVLVCAVCSEVDSQSSVNTHIEQYIDTLKNSHRITYIGGIEADSINERRMLDIFYYDQFRHAQDPRT